MRLRPAPAITTCSSYDQSVTAAATPLNLLIAEAAPPPGFEDATPAPPQPGRIRFDPVAPEFTPRGGVCPELAVVGGVSGAESSGDTLGGETAYLSQGGDNSNTNAFERSNIDVNQQLGITQQLRSGFLAFQDIQSSREAS